MKGVCDETSKAIAARVHIENIRKMKFSIGSKAQNPLTKDLHNAVTRLSSELYAKDIHFLMELIQNAEDNKYPCNVEPALEFVFTKEDVTGNGAPATLLVFNNEMGFSKSDIDSICSIGQSTKKAKRSQGFIGEKGIGFKSVFLVSAQPYIFSNGYRIRFCEVPNEHCGIGYIVPEWITERPSISDLGRIYGNGLSLPTTAIILPLKPEKVEAVKKQLLQIHPEVLLFLEKIRHLTVRGSSLSLKGSSSAVSIMNETTIIPQNNEVMDSRVVRLSAQQGGMDASLETCRYYIHKHIFPIKPDIIVEERKDAKELMICLAFPFDERLQRGGSDVGIFAFLPTEMVTDFPFIIHSDFVLASSREAILMDNKWNLGTLKLVPLAYVRALMTCLDFVERTGLGMKSCVLDFLPIHESPFPELNSVRDSIKLMLQSECIVPCRSFLDEQIVFCRPNNALPICPEFHKILAKAKLLGISLGVVSSQMKHAIHDSVDREEYDDIWVFLDVDFTDSDYDWYLKIIKTANLISRSSDDLYIDIICFLDNNWNRFPNRSVNSIPLLKYVIWSGDTMLCSVVQLKQDTLKVRIVWETNEHALLSNWNREIGCPNDVFFCPVYLVNSLVKVENQEKLKSWFTYTAGVVITDIYKYCKEMISSIRKSKDTEIVVQLTHFLYYSSVKNHIKPNDMQTLLLFLPVVEKSGKLCLCSRSLVPAATGTWTNLFGMINPLSVEYVGVCSVEIHNLNHHNDTDNKQICGYYAELGDVYLVAAEVNGETIGVNSLLDFLVKNGKAFDLPKAPPPNRPLKLASATLTCDQAFLLLEWIKYLKSIGYLLNRARFSESIRDTNWLKTYTGFRSPKHCYLLNNVENEAILELGRKLKVFSAIDEVYYSSKIRSYIDELEFLGVQTKAGTMSELVTPLVKQMASSKIVDPELVILLMGVIKYLREKNKLDEDLKKKLKEGKWLKTLNGGYACPYGSVFLASLKTSIRQITTNLPVVDSSYYGGELSPFLYELESLGVVVDVEEVYKLIFKTFKLPEDLSSLTVDSVFLLLECVRSVGPAAFSSIHDIRCKAWIRTHAGLKSPSETILLDSNLIDLVSVVSYSFIDESCYEFKIRTYKEELKSIGVIVGLDSAGESVVNRFKSLISSTGLSALNVISLLRLFKSAGNSMPFLVNSVVNYMSGEKWVKTKHGYQNATNSILYDSEWASISQLVDLSFIDETFYGVELSSFKEELKILGVVVNLRDGINFIVHNIKVQEDPSLVTADAAFVILQCVESLQNSNVASGKVLLSELLQKMTVSKWVKTRIGYRLPSEALLFNNEWDCLLKEFDGPFVHREFYKKFTSAQYNVLRVIGVKTDLEDVCSLIVKNLTFHVRSYQVNRIYKFLQKFRWTPKPEDHLMNKLWIPNKSDNSRGKWVNNVDCVIHDENNLFTHCLNSLDNYYDESLLPFLQLAFDVPETPSLDHLIALWKTWCETTDKMSVEKVQLFWGLLSRNPVGDVLHIQSTFTKLPAIGVRPGMDIELLEKEHVYIGDELLLKKAFSESSEGPLFAWFPENNSISYVTLVEFYKSLGVKKISESVEYSVNEAYLKMEKEVDLIGKPLLKLILAFLASPGMSLPAKERHLLATALFDIPIFWTDVELQVKYRLTLPLSNKCLCAHVYKMVFFDSKVPRFLVHRPSWCKGKKDVQLINDFARSISDAVIVSDSFDLAKLIKMGFHFLCDEHDIDVLLMLENLEFQVLDQIFLDQLFSSAMVVPSKRKLHVGNPSVPCTPKKLK